MKMANKNYGKLEAASIVMIQAESESVSVSVPIDNQPPAQQQLSYPQPHQLGSQLAAQNKRKEKARIAARARRSQEAKIIMEMANELHITQEKVRKIDKATIVKLAIDYIKAFEILCRFRNANSNSPTSSLSSSRSSNSCVASSNDNSSNINFYMTSYENDSSSNSIDNNKYSRSNSICDGGNDTNYTISISNSDGSSKCSNDRGIYDTKLSTSSIFTPKTDDMDSHFLMIDESDGRPSFILKPDTEIADEDDLTHLAPQAGDVSISLEVESLEGILLDTGLFGASSPTGPISLNDDSSIIFSSKNMAPPFTTMMNTKDLIEICCISNNGNNIGSVD